MGRIAGAHPSVSMNLDIQAVTFDVGGTLIEPWPSVGHIYASVAARHGRADLDPRRLTGQFGAAWKSKTSFDYSLDSWRELVEQTFAGAIPPERLDALFGDIYARFEQPDAWRIFDDVLPALAALRSAGFKLGVISNWDGRLRPLLERLDLSRYFDVIAISVEAGEAKPAPGIFARTAALLEIPPEQILHVGDSLNEDVAGAQAAGFSALRVSRSGGNDWGMASLGALPAALGIVRPGGSTD